MYIPKFNYLTIPREEIEGQRRYATPDGQKLPSVTTVLDATKPEEAKQALAQWRARVGHQRAKEITTEAASRGTRMHKYLEDYVLSGELRSPGGNPHSIQSHQMASTIITKGLSNCSEFWGSEVNLYFPGVYAGTTDLVGVHKGAPAILDFKQTNKPKKTEWIQDYFLQLAAYATAHNEVYGTEINKGVILMCSASNEYQEWAVEGAEFQQWVGRWFSRLEEYYVKFG